MTRKSSVVSLFSGCGGLDLGFQGQGYDLVYACDSDPAAVDCYSRNVDTRVYCRDVNGREFIADIASLGTCDVVLGGFPCQGFSKAGPKNEGDSRNLLYVQMRNTVARLQPQIFIAENVDGMSQNFEGIFLNRVVSDFEVLGYRVEHRILDAVAYGVPQHRRRVVFVGTREQSNRRFRWPHPTHAAKTRNGEFKVADGPLLWGVQDYNGFATTKPITIQEAIGDLRELKSSIPDHCVGTWPKHYASIFRTVKQGQKLCNVRHSESSVRTWDIPDVFGPVSERERLILDTIARHRRHKQYGDIPNGNPLPVAEIESLSRLSAIKCEIRSLLDKGYLKDVGGAFDLKGALFCSGIFKRPMWDEPAPTVLTNFYNPRYFLHPLEDRPFSLRECARLQGFPDSFCFLSDAVDLISAYRLVGNAVPPPLSRQLASAVHLYLRSSDLVSATA